MGETEGDTLVATYKAVMRLALEYSSSIWPLLASLTSISKLQVMQNAALRTATGCTQDTHIQQLHDKTLTLSIDKLLQHHASQYKQNIITSLTQTYNILQHSTVKNTLHLQQRPYGVPSVSKVQKVHALLQLCVHFYK